MSILSKVSGGAITKVLGGALIITVIAMILLTRYSFTLRASLDEATTKYETLVEYSIKQSKLLSE